MNETVNEQAGKPWFAFEAGKPSPEAIRMAREWVTAQGIERALDDLVEVVCTDLPDSSLEGSVHLLVWNEEIEGGDSIDLASAEHLGVLEDSGSEHDPYNVVVAASLERDGDTWVATSATQH